MKEDLVIIDRVHDLAEKYGVSMSEIALAWQFARGVAAPIVGATKVPHFDQAVRSVDLQLSEEDVRYLEETYTPRELVGLIRHS